MALAEHDVYATRLLSQNGTNIDPDKGTDALEPFFRAEYTYCPIADKYSVVLTVISDPRYSGQFYFDHKLVGYAQTKRFVDMLTGRWRRKRRMKFGRRNTKLVSMSK